MIACDGNSYEKDAIKNWIDKKTDKATGKTKSPMTNELMDTMLFPNRNLQKLIRDLIDEGGAGLYVEDKRAKHVIEVQTEKTIIVSGIGPGDSEWNQKTYHVRSSGCIGGRADFSEEIKRGQEVMQFKDIGASRKHFRIDWVRDYDRFCIKDLGSVGGTFIRIPYSKKKELHPGMMLLLGTHQFTVSSIIDEPLVSPSNSDSDSEVVAKEEASLRELLAQVSSIEISNEDENARELRERLRNISSKLSEHVQNSNKSSNSNSSGGSKSATAAEGANQTRKICILTCFQPELSPILGKTYKIGPEGGLIGRKASCSVSISTQTLNHYTGEYKTVEIDNAVSSEHARIELNQESGQFYITDGGAAKASTNGIWWRLSGPQQESVHCPLESTVTEFIVGKSRFSVKEYMTVRDKDVSSSSSSSKGGDNDNDNNNKDGQQTKL